MKKSTTSLLGAAIAAVLVTPAANAEATSITEALTTGKAYGDFRLRYEEADIDNGNDEDASALTLRSRFGYTTGTISGFSATIEAEDSRIVADQDDFSNPVRPTEFDVIADPESTEIDQFFLQYKNDVVGIKAGRQVITLDDHRFVGHVGWRQDRQTFDALNITVNPADKFTINYSHIGQRNRIFAVILIMLLILTV